MPTQLVRDIMTDVRGRCCRVRHSGRGRTGHADLRHRRRTRRWMATGSSGLLPTVTSLSGRSPSTAIRPRPRWATSLAPTRSVVAPDQPAADAVQLMRDHALRRLPVCEDGHLVGVLSLGNLATERDPESALADISAAPPDH